MFSCKDGSRIDSLIDKAMKTNEGVSDCTFFLLLFGSILLGERRWIAMVIVSLAAPLSIWLLVTYVLQRTIVPLPAPLMNLIGG